MVGVEVDLDTEDDAGIEDLVGEPEATGTLAISGGSVTGGARVERGGAEAGASALVVIAGDE